MYAEKKPEFKTKVTNGSKMVEIDLDSDICPSCGLKKECKNRPLCLYCYHRSAVGAVKFFILLIMHESQLHMTVREIVDVMNNHPINNRNRISINKSIGNILKNISRKKYRLLFKEKKTR